LRLPRAELVDLSFSWPIPGIPNGWLTLFSFRCGCGVLTLGCQYHWFCGLCETCRAAIEADMPAAE